MLLALILRIPRTGCRCYATASGLLFGHGQSVDRPGRLDSPGRGLSSVPLSLGLTRLAALLIDGAPCPPFGRVLGAAAVFVLLLAVLVASGVRAGFFGSS